MIYNNTNELVEMLKRENLWAQKKLGQNFLVNPQALENIIKAAEIKPTDHVLEIGPGLGILTEQLARRANNVTAIELDRQIIPVLQRNLNREEIKNVFIINEDALQTKLPHEPYKLIANIPYYITSPILNHFLQPKIPGEIRPKLLVLLVQKEVAEKICVPEVKQKAGSNKTSGGDETILSLQVKAFGKPSIVCNVSSSSFFPQPKVDSAVIKIETYDQPKISNIGYFFTFIKGAFSQKRKKLSNTLPHALNLTPDQSEKLFETSKVSADKRPQNISLEEWEALIQAYEKISREE